MATEKYVHSGREVKVPELDRPLGAFLVGRIRQHTNPAIQINGVTGEKVSAEQLLQFSLSVASELQSRGIRPGDVVVCALDNGPENAQLLLGTLCIGAVYAPFYPDLHPDDLSHMMDILSPRLVLCSPRAVATFRSALSSGVDVVTVSADDAGWDAFRSHGASNVQTCAGVDFDSAAVVMCSSGTTGRPKAVELSHRNLHFPHELIRTVRSQRPGSDQDVALLVLPNFWMSGVAAMLISLYCGTTLVSLPSFDVDSVLGAVQKYRVTDLTLSPPQVVAIAKHPGAVEQYDVSSLRLVVHGGAPMSAAMKAEAERRVGKRFSHLYGQTEALLPTTVGPLSLLKPDAVGIPAPGVQLKIVNHDTGEVLGPNTEGELYIRSPARFQRYRNNQRATEHAVDADGWLHTGDVAKYDDDGYFYICDRYKDLVKYRGVHIAPTDVEDVLLKHPAVKDAAVVGIEHDEDQEHPVGFVVLKDGEEVKREDLINRVKEELPEYKWLHGGLHFITEVPRNLPGKIKRKDLRELARKLTTT